MSEILEGINPELNDMIRRGQLSGKKITALHNLRIIVDRYAVNDYVSEEECSKLKDKYGAFPNVRSWGDYFQTEIASRYFEYSDEEFLKIVSTVRFDIIAAVKIFSGKSHEFFEQIELDAVSIMAIDSEIWTDDQAEKAHLNILMRYYIEMGLEKSEIPAEDEEWFLIFSENASVKAG